MASSVLPERASTWPWAARPCASLTLAALISAVGTAGAFGAASLSEPSENEPRSNEQPHSVSPTRTTAMRETFKQASELEKAIPAKCSRVLYRKGSLLCRKVHRAKKPRTSRPAFSELWIARNGSARTARTSAATAAARTAIAAGAGAEGRLRLHRQQAFALQLLARQLAGAAHGFRLFAGLLLGGLLVMTAELHLAENPLAL